MTQKMMKPRCVKARSIGSTEFAWRFFQFSIPENLPSVVQLAVHLLNGQSVYFAEETAPDVARSDPPSKKKEKKTTTTKQKQTNNYSKRIFSTSSREHPSFASTLSYVDFPRFHT